MARPAHASSRAATAGARQKASAAPAVCSNNRAIDSFGRVSKRVFSSSTKKASALRPDAVTVYLADKNQEQQEQLATKPKTTTAVSRASTASSALSKKKRNASDVFGDDVDSAVSISSKRARQQKETLVDNARPKRQLKRQKHELEQKQEQKQQTRRDSLPCLTVSLSPPLSRSASSSPQPASTAPTTPFASDSEPETPDATPLPAALFDLLRLQAAFAKTLALHHAHQGNNAPVDVRELCPAVAQAWGKRQVTLEDVQRCIGGARTESAGSALFLADYSRGKICIELQPNAVAAGVRGNLGDRLVQVFEAQLRLRWAEARASGHDEAHVIETLPKEPIKKCASLILSSALRAKGQRSLVELMEGIALRKQEKESEMGVGRVRVGEDSSSDNMQTDGEDGRKQQPTVSAASASQPSQPSPLSPAAPPMSLLDRIRFRQLQRSRLAATTASPTPEELERRAGLQRACDIAEVLMMLGASSATGRPQSRVSFSLAAILNKLKDSLRLPISRDEGASCVRLLATEVAPQWLQLVSMGGREIVIMLTDFTPSKSALHSRVEELSR